MTYQSQHALVHLWEHVWFVDVVANVGKVIHDFSCVSGTFDFVYVSHAIVVVYQPRCNLLNRWLSPVRSAESNS